MKLTIVGSGTAAPEAERVCSGYFLETDRTTALLDCGPGVVHHLALFELPWRRLDHLFITHFHNDHIGDIPMLLFALKWGSKERRTEPLTVWGPVGLKERMGWMARAMGDHVADPGFPLEVIEIEPGDEVSTADISVAVAKTPHTDESVAYRIGSTSTSKSRSTSKSTSVGYTGDTGPSEEVARFMEGVDVLLAECSLGDDEAMATHLTPSSLARMANIAGPGRLVVTHVYPWLDERGVVGLVGGAGWKGETVRARDGLSVEI